jgi:paired amphipathic helix protein Sin3a
VLFRLHQILYERVSAAKHAAKEAEEKWRQSKDSAPPDLYAKYVDLVYDVRFSLQ